MSNLENMTNLCHNLYMFVTKCLPFSKSLNKESLSYFSSKYLEPGSLLKINLRGKNIPALVLESESATDIKAQIKNADFQLKKVSALTAKPFLQKEFLESVKATCDYFAATAGGVVTHLFHSLILENPSLLPTLKEEIKSDNLERKSKSEVSVLQAPDEERFMLYRSLIREEFARKKSVFLCLPQNEDILQAKEKLERGIESFVHIFHKDINKKDFKKEWKKAYSNIHPVLIIATARWLFLPRNDFGTIIIDKENENGWKTLSRPFIDLRFFAETLAIKKNIRVIIGDSFLRTETLFRYKQGEIGEYESVKWRLSKDVATEIIDLKKYSKKEKEFKTLAPEMLELIRETVSSNSNMFIFAARKGLSAVTVCRDCGEQVKCKNCSAPMILYRTKTKSPNGFSDGGAFKCHQCGETRDAAEVCQNCGSWKLAAFGAGLDRVAEEIKKEIPSINLFEIYKEIATTGTKASEIVKNFYENRGSILLGTEMAFSYLNKKVTNTAIVSFDSLFSIPDFRIREKIFRLILQTKDLAKEKFLIQTRNPDDSTIAFATSGNLTEFYREEVSDRQVLDYPPFGVFIKITARGTRNFVTRESENLKKIFKDYNPAIFNSIHEKRGEQSAVNAVIKIAKENWPARNTLASEAGGPQAILLNILKSLPPHFEIKIDPDNLL